MFLTVACGTRAAKIGAIMDRQAASRPRLRITHHDDIEVSGVCKDLPRNHSRQFSLRRAPGAIGA